MNTQQPVVPLSESGLRSIQRNADDIGREVTDSYFEAHPECYRGDADKIRAMCKADFNHHLKFLLSAMVTATPEMFVDYAQWLKEVLETRGFSIQHPIDSFTLMKNSINQRLDDIDIKISTLVIDSGVNALSGNESFRGYYKIDEDKILETSTDYTRELVNGNRSIAEDYIKKSLDQGTSLIDIEVGIVQPAMYEIGRMWQQNKISVAQEHLATAISQNALARAFAMAEFADPVDRLALCACIEGNHHSLGLRMVSDAYELSGWEVSFLGSDTPNSSILSQVDSENPDVLALSVSLPHQIITLQQLITQLKAEMGSKMPAIVVGGLAFNNHQNLSSRLQVDNWYLDAKSVMDDAKE